MRKSADLLDQLDGTITLSICITQFPSTDFRPQFRDHHILALCTNCTDYFVHFEWRTTQYEIYPP